MALRDRIPGQALPFHLFGLKNKYTISMFFKNSGPVGQLQMVQMARPSADDGGSLRHGLPG